MDAKTRKRVRQLHALCGSDNDAEATAARRKLIELLRRRGKTWNDLDAILAMDVPPAQQPPDPQHSGQPIDVHAALGAHHHPGRLDRDRWR